MKASSYKMQGSVRGSVCTRLGSPLARAQGKRPSRQGATTCTAARLQHHARLVTGQAAFVLRAASSDVESSETSAKSSSILEDLKNAAMHLHTKDQAASGGQEAKKERPEFVPTREGYLRYLMDSREIFSTLEEIVNANPKLSKLKANGLERTGALDKDIAMLSGMGIQPFGYEEGETSPGTEYVKYLKEMSEKNLPGFMCHYYNTYFAHTAGGRMIGKAVADKILDGAKLDFYHDYPEKNVKKLSAPVKDLIEDIALDWSQEERDQCTGQTPKAFQFAGQVMRQITASSSSK